jgi:hypothetical protein
VVPSDHKWFARVVIGSAIVSVLEELNLRFPRADKASLQEFKQVRTALETEGEAQGKSPSKGSVKRPAKRAKRAAEATKRAAKGT